jgi:hypothetical protein
MMVPTRPVQETYVDVAAILQDEGLTRRISFDLLSTIYVEEDTP